MSRSRLAGAVALALFAATVVPRLDLVHAGDRQLEVLLVNMTPDAKATRASSTCVANIRKVIAKDYSRVTKLGESKLRALVDKPKGGEAFVSWDAKRLEKAKQSNQDTWYDAIVLVDCRPDERVIDILVSGSDHSLTTFQLRKREVTEPIATWLGKALMQRAWLGFSP